MTKYLLTILILLITLQLSAQTTITGFVTDTKNNPIEGANVYLEGTYDGNTTNVNGQFTFTTSETGTPTLIVSFVSYESYQMTSDVRTLKNLKITLRDDVNTLDTVILSAGTFSAGDNSKVSVLKPLDVVTTASALGDFVGALQTLPGTTTVAEDGRLFVRGGEAEETQIFIDGIRVFTPYTPTTNNSPTRGRYSPFLFDGITFSTGGYSAEYGQALSSVLLLNTIDEPDQEKTDIGIMSVGATLGSTQKWDRNALSVNASYINLGPYLALFKDRNHWIKPFQTGSGEAVYRHQTNNGLLKAYTAFDASKFELIQEDINNPEGIRFKLKNNNVYFNSSYQARLKKSWTLSSGFSYTQTKTNSNINTRGIEATENSLHSKFKLRKKFNNRFKINFGAEFFATYFNEAYQDAVVLPFDYGYDNGISVVFGEADLIFSRQLALKVGLRGEYSELLNETRISPRLSFAYKTGKRSQLSFAYGDFYQNPNSGILKFEQHLKAEHAQHYILNYQYNNDGRIFRAETYYKNYSNLVKYDTEFAKLDSDFNNQGVGYAKGLDLFYRDNKSFKNMDYWVSYSFLDTARDYRNYPVAAQPNFANSHNLSLVGKYWIEDWKSQIGFSYALASGRSYTNPNLEGFLNQKTKNYSSLSLNWAYLLSQQKILYFSVNNVLATKNVNGYQYANTADVNNTFARRALRPAADQFFFVGFFLTISEKGTDNQLDNL